MKHEKLGSALAATYEKYRSAGWTAVNRSMRLLGVHGPKPAAAAPRVTAFLHCDDDADFSHLSQLGVTVNQRAGRIRTAIVPLDRLDRLTDENAVHRISAAQRLHPRLDVARAKTNVPAFIAKQPANPDRVVIGIVDSGIDTTLAAFSGRIDRIWDQTLQGPGVAEGAYGLELLPQSFGQTTDTHGHGTHVAGIAAGLDPKFSGIAPHATIVFVKTDFDNTHIADGVRYLFRVADDLGLPCVVNLSLGGHMDSHDGLDDLSQIIDGQSGAGKIVCCAAGNEGLDNMHARTTVGPAAKSIRFQVSAGLPEVVLNGWYPRGQSVEIAVRSPSRQITPFQPLVAAGTNPTNRYSLPDGDVLFVTAPPATGTADTQFLAVLQPAFNAQTVTAGLWQLFVKAPLGTFDVNVWLVDGDGGSRAVFTGTSVANDMKIGSPGSCTSAITVASYTTRVQWNDSQGNLQRVGLTLDDLSAFSSPGPLRNGALKPDITAPGAMIVSANSSAASPPPTQVIDPQHRVDAGTSMASPFVTGIVAVLLERNPKLTPAQVRTALASAGVLPAGTPGPWDPRWGAGLVDASKL